MPGSLYIIFCVEETTHTCLQWHVMSFLPHPFLGIMSRFYSSMLFISHLLCAAPYSWFWSLWRHIFPSSDWGYWFSVFMVGSKCDVGVLMWRGLLLVKIEGFYVALCIKITSIILTHLFWFRPLLFFKKIWKMLKPVLMF